MKKEILKKVLLVLFAVVTIFSMSACMVTDEAGNQSIDIFSTGMLVVLAGVLVFMMLRNSKQKKKEQQQRASLEVGDGITTIGGIIGRVVSIKDDVFVLETSSDRTRIRFHKNAIQSIDKLKVED